MSPPIWQPLLLLDYWEHSGGIGCQVLLQAGFVLPVSGYCLGSSLFSFFFILRIYFTFCKKNTTIEIYILKKGR